MAALLLLSCGEGTDSRFATPEHTVATLLAAHGLADVSSDEIRARAATGYPVRDRAAHEACFADLDRPGGEALAGYVVGVLAAGRDDLRYETVGDRGLVRLPNGPPIVMERTRAGAYRIVLEQSVPEDLREPFTAR
jgi:hypothetical protein